MSTSTPMVTATPSTTYPYAYTTFINASPSAFTKPTAIPSIFSWGSVESCSTPATSSSPPERPSNRAGGCTISNEAGVNDHAFWDMYACCESGNTSVLGAPLPCTAVCWADGDQTFLDLGRCLSERVEVVVCSPPEDERGQQPEGPGGGAGGSATSAVETQSGSGSADATGPTFTGAASTVGRVHVASSTAGLVIFGLMALASSAAMFL